MQTGTHHREVLAVRVWIRQVLDVNEGHPATPSMGYRQTRGTHMRSPSLRKEGHPVGKALE